MAKGKPDSQHELVISGLSRCLELAYPLAEFSRGSKLLDVGLKPDICVAHPDGRRWVYEAVNQNAGIEKIEANHQTYTEAGIRDYWILWEARGPDKPLDRSALSQSVWLGEETADTCRCYSLNRLQRVLAALGNGTLYVFAVNKPIQKRIEHWAVRLGMINFLIYHFPADALDKDQVIGDCDLIPLPYLAFDEHGGPMTQVDIDSFAGLLRSFTELPSDRPVFFLDTLKQLDGLALSPGVLVASMKDAFARMAEQHKDVELPPTEELARAWQSFQLVAADIRAHPSDTETDTIRVMERLDDLVAALPPELQSAFRGVLPLNGDLLKRILEMKQWYEEDEYLQALLDAV
jgi:hypothetical protein